MRSRRHFTTAAGLLVLVAGCAHPEQETHQRRLTIGPDPVPCADGTPGACLRVTDAEGDSWITRLDEIEGFAYEPGYTYELLVEEPSRAARVEAAAPPRLRLVRVLSREASGVSRQDLPEDLGRPKWVLSAIEPSAHPAADWATSGITAQFDVWGGRLSGFAGCNNYSAGFTVAGDRIEIAPPASTRKACPSDLAMALEAEYLERIARADAFVVSDDRLELSLSDGSGMAFRKAGR
ncbi:MAG TPA: META domain-containing protein [Geminicoccaceae bacterium]|nr:META domain-containing protein [Geminicoccaceae bacterium]